MSESEHRGRRFSPEEVSEIIRRASELSPHDDDRLSYDDLVEVATEVGIDEQAVADAIEEATAAKQAESTAPAASPKHTTVDYVLAFLCIKPLESYPAPAPPAPPA